MRFIFHKTNQTLYSMEGDPNNLSYEWSLINNVSLLPGAGFIIYRWDSRTTSPPAGVAGLVRAETTGPGQWVYFDSDTSSGSVHTPIIFDLDRRYAYYQLVETMPPAGFSPPTGQWRVSIAQGTTSPGTGWYYAQHNRWLHAGNINDLWMPGFIRQPQAYASSTPNNTPGAGQWYVGNIPSIELPLSGGTGRDMFMYSGTFMLLLAAGLMVCLVRRRKLPAR